MNEPKTLDDLNTRALDTVTEAHRLGIEVGLRRMHAKPGLTCLGKLYEAIEELDDDFHYKCPCTRFVDDHCKRCGRPDPFAAEKKA